MRCFVKTFQGAKYIFQIEARFISLSLDLMKEFANSNIVIPGTKIRIDEFINEILKELYLE